ncbi:MAG TPA: hypothetical protein VIK14_15570 [Ignavibacteria bacterium]
MHISTKSLFALFIFCSIFIFSSCIDWGNMWGTDFVGSTAINNDATDITENSAILNASVLPNSENVNVSFRLWIGDITGSLNEQTIQANPSYIPSSTKWTTVSAKATGLTSKTTYYFGILIENDNSMYPAKSFTTL